MRALLACWLAMGMMATPASAYYPWDVWKADRAFQRGDFAVAAGHYQQALQAAPGDARALYGLGECLYRRGKFSEAAQSFRQALEAGNPEFRARAAYNLGNSLFRQDKLQEALEAYKTALRWDETDDDARHNIQVILDKLKKQQNDRKQPPQKGKDQKQQDQSDQDKKQQDQDKKQQDQDQKQPRDQGGQEKGKDPKDQDPKAPNRDRDRGAGQPRQGPMSKEDAERLLKYFADREKKGKDREGRLIYPPVRGTETW